MSNICVNGRVNPSADTKLRLFADSAGHCSRPECHPYLFSDHDIAGQKLVLELIDFQHTVGQFDSPTGY